MDAIICDLDGTLLNNKQEISDRTLDKLTTLKQKHHFKLIICTGRHLFSIKNVASKILPLVDYYITQNGSLVLDKSFKKIADKQISNKLFKELFYKFYQRLEEYCIYDEDKALCFIDYENFKDNSPAKGIVYYPGKIEEYSKAVNKIAFIAKKEVLEKVKSELSEYNDKIEYFFSRETFLDVIKKGVNKGQAVTDLINNILFDNVYIFGDNDNDESMLALDYNTVSMKNGSFLAKRVAKSITKYSNDEDGVVWYLETKIYN